MVIRAYLICALMTSILGIISCSVHDIINWFPIVLLYAWIILSPISILALITVYLLGVQRDWICKIPLICLCAFIVYFINLNSSESYLINFFATQTVPYDLLYYNNGIEIRVNDTIFSIFRVFRNLEWWHLKEYMYRLSFDSYKPFTTSTLGNV